MSVITFLKNEIGVVNLTQTTEVGEQTDSKEPENLAGIVTSDGGQTHCRSSYNPAGAIPKILIISNDQSKTPLRGYKCDAKNLEDFWRAKFGYRVTRHDNLDVLKMFEAIKNFSDSVVEENDSFCGVFLLSHGDYVEAYGDVIYGTDEGEKGCIAVEDILRLFDNCNNVKLQNTPKFFVLQCCRGGNMTQAVRVGGPAVAAGGDGSKIELPRISDTLVMYATQPKDVAIVDSDGSWLIKDIVEVFKNQSENEHLVDMLTIVNKKVSERIVKDAHDRNLVGVKCMSEIRSTLPYKLYLKGAK